MSITSDTTVTVDQLRRAATRKGLRLQKLRGWPWDAFILSDAATNWAILGGDIPANAAEIQAYLDE